MRFVLSQQKTLLTITLISVVLATVFSSLFIPANAPRAFAAPNYEINYQGKLTNASNVAVADGTYNMRFWLLTTNSIATTSAVWTESLTGTNKVQVTNGIFSVMLGSTSPLTSVDFNQALYLGVEIGGSTTPSWDGEMSPRKILGAVPAAFRAEYASSSRLFDGLATTSFLRNDQADTASGLLTFTGGIISNSSSTITNLTSLIATTTTLVINSESFTDLTGSGLINSNSALTCATANSSTFGCLTSTDWSSFNGRVSSSSIDTESELETLMIGLDILTVTSDDITSANLATLITNETGSGNVVFSASPTFTGTAMFANIYTTTTGTSTLGYASTTALTVSGNSIFNFTSTSYASTTGLTAGNVNFTNATSSILAVTTLGVGTDYITDITGTGLSITNGVLNVTSDGVSNWSLVNGALAPSTTVGVTITASSTIQNLTIINGTTTNATSTTLFTSTFGLGTDYLTDLTGTSLVIANGALSVATSTFFTDSSTFSSWLTDETGTGNVVFSASPTFTGTATFANTNATFASSSYASTTGLTAQNAYFGGNVGIGTISPNARLDIFGTAGSQTNLLTIASSTGSTSLAVLASGDVEVPNNFISAGVKWTARSAVGDDDSWTSITYGNGLFVAVAGTTTSTSTAVMTSPDGINWTIRSGAEANSWEGVTYGNGLFVAVSQDGANRVMTSPDGINWTARSAAGDDDTWLSVTYGNGLFVAVGSLGGDVVMTSPDGINWTPRSAAGDNDFWFDVTYGNGLFVAISWIGDIVMTSPDGINWTPRSASGDWNAITYGNGLFVAVGYAGLNRVMTSPDGITWTPRSVLGNNESWYSVTYGNGLFVAVGYANDRVMTSPDGINWTARSAAGDNDTWQGVTYGNGLFVAVGGSGDRVITSGKSLTSALATNNIYQGGMSVMGGLNIGTTTATTSALYGLNILNIASTTGNQLLTFTNQGYLGLGTTSPSRLLTIQGGDLYVGGNITATGTLEVSGLATLTYASSTGFTTTNANLANATTTNFFASTASTSVFRGAGLTDCDADNQTLAWDVTTGTFSCGDDDSGSGADGVSNWSLVNGALTPSTTVGVGIFASSTIGDGTATGGLTISGNSTTTGSGYFGNRVVIGITNSTYGLHVATTSYFSHSATFNSSTVHNGNFLSSVSAVYGYNDLILGTAQNGIGNTERFRISSTTGNVGIGSSTPSRTLTVSGDAIMANLTATGTLNVSGLATLGYASTTAVSGTNLNFTNATTSSLYTTTLGLGTDYLTDLTGTSLVISNGALSVSTSTFFTDSSTFSSWLTDETGTGNVVFSASPTFTGTALFSSVGVAGSLSFTYATTTSLTISQNAYLSGNMGLGTTTVSRRLTVVGDSYFQNNITAASSTITYASSTALTVSGNSIFNFASSSYASTTGFTAGNAYFTNATSSILAATTLGVGTDYLTDITGTGLSITNGMLNVTATGDGVSNWSFNGSRLTPSTTVGIGIFASSTIGDGTATGGLTINGSATTTNLIVTALTASRAIFTDANNLFTTTGVSQYLSDALSDETGSGSLVFSASPTFTGTATFANIYSASTGTSTLGYASTTGLTNSGNVYLGTVQSGTWNGTALTDTYVADAITVTGGNLGANTIASSPTWTNAGTLTITGNTILSYASSTGLTVSGNSYFNFASSSYASTTGLTAQNAYVGGSFTLGTDAITDLTGTSLVISNGALSVSTSTFFTDSSTFSSWLTDETGTGNVVFSASPTFTGTATFANTNATFASSSYASTTGFTAGNGYIDVLGVGTSTPISYKLAVDSGSSVNVMRLGSTAAGAKWISAFDDQGTASEMLRISRATLGTRIDTYSGGNLLLMPGTLDGNGGAAGVSNANVGIGTTSPYALLSVSGSAINNGSSSYAPLIAIANTRDNVGSSYAGLDFVTDEIGGENQYRRAQIFSGYDSVGGDNVSGFIAFSTAAPTTGTLTERLRISKNGNVGIGTTTPTSLLTMGSTTLSGAQVAGIKQHFGFTNSVASAILYGDETYITNIPTATSTLVGKIIRIADTSTLGNTVRGLEVQAHRGTNTKGENTGISAFGRTFGVKGVTEGDAGDTALPAGVFAETRGTTQGNALRAYSGTITTEELVSLFHDGSAFSGTGLQMNFGNTSGSFAATSTGKFVDFQVAGTSRFTVTAGGTTTIGDGTTNNVAGLQIGYGGICVDNDGSCTASTTGRITSVSLGSGNSDLAEMYFSNQSLHAGEIVSLTGGLSVQRAEESTKGNIIGVVSTKPGLLLGFDDTSLIAGESGYPVGLKGRVPIKLSTENGPIKKGDRIALSSIPGVGMKATESSRIVGVALEDYDGTKAYTTGFLNQFGDDMARERLTPRTTNTDARTQDGCYNGGGNELGEAGCTPDVVVPKIVALSRDMSRENELRALAAESALETTTASGETTYIGQAIMFIELGWYAMDREALVLKELTSTSTFAGTDETLWSRLKKLAEAFVGGSLSVFEIKADKIDVRSELCVDGVCVTADDLRALLLNAHRDNSSEESEVPEEESADDSSSDGEENNGSGEDIEVPNSDAPPSGEPPVTDTGGNEESPPENLEPESPPQESSSSNEPSPPDPIEETSDAETII